MDFNNDKDGTKTGLDLVIKIVEAKTKLK